MKKSLSIILILQLLLLFSSVVYSQEPASLPATPVQPSAQTQTATPPAAQPSSPQLTPQQAETLQKLPPGQQQPIPLTPEAIEILKTRPEFQGLTPEEVLKGMEELKKKEAEKKEPEKKELPVVVEKRVIGEEPEEKSVFARYRKIGSKYQDISMDLKPFGYEFFREAAVKVLTERKDIPVPSDYIVGPGDEVKMLLWGRVNAQYNPIIDRDGNINIPQIGPLHVAGMTFEQMARYLIKQAEQIIGANISVTMGSLKTIPIFILGDAKRPGAYTIGSFATITDALLFAGGPNDIGSMRNVQLKRKDKVITTFDLYDLLLKGDKSKDKILQAGDIVFVPVTGPLTGIAGNVRRPAIYELKDKNDLMTLIDLSGGIIPTAYTQQIQVERIIKGERQIVIDINDKDLSQAKYFILQDGDLVKVFPIVEKDMNAIYLYGNIKRPGKYEYKQGMHIKDLIKDTTELLPETYFKYALIKRLRLPDLRTEIVPFNLGALLLDNDNTNNIELMPQDIIYVFSKWFFKDKPFITVDGETRKGGRFDLAENMKVKDAVLTAGDLTKDAYLKKGEIIRVDEKRQYRTMYFNVGKALEDDPEENLILQDEDRIIIHSLWEEKWKETVSISGEVKKPQEFILTESMTVSDIVFKAGGITRDSYLEEAELYRTDWRTKEVTLQRFNLKKALENDPEHNIKLKDIDKVVVHSIWEKVYKKNVSVDGDVTKPGTYQYAENMTVRDLVFAAGNVLESAYLDEAEVSSQIVENGKIAKTEHRKINLKKALEGDPTHNLLLKPYDRLFVKRLSDWRKEQFVNISGEVHFPGRYVIKKGERLSSILERAGGYKDTAHLRGAVFTRERVREIQKKSLDEMADRLERELLAASATLTATALTPEEAEIRKTEVEQRQKFIESLKKLKPTGRMAIRLAHLRLLKGSEFDIELEDGDSLFIPSENRIVNVAGAVFAPGSFIYRSEFDYMDYISQSAGFSRYADTSNVYVLKVDGTARKLSRGFISWNPFKSRWEVSAFEGEIKEIEPGDTIVVPERLERIAWLREIKDITQILFQIAVTTGVVWQLF